MGDDPTMRSDRMARRARERARGRHCRRGCPAFGDRSRCETRSGQEARAPYRGSRLLRTWHGASTAMVSSLPTSDTRSKRFPGSDSLLLSPDASARVPPVGTTTAVSGFALPERAALAGNAAVQRAPPSTCALEGVEAASQSAAAAALRSRSGRAASVQGIRRGLFAQRSLADASLALSRGCELAAVGAHGRGGRRRLHDVRSSMACKTPRRRPQGPGGTGRPCGGRSVSRRRRHPDVGRAWSSAP